MRWQPIPIVNESHVIMAIPDHTLLAQFSPLDTLSTGRLKELASLSFVEKVNKGLDPFRLDSVKPAQAIYLLSGKLGLRMQDGINRTLQSNSESTQHAIDPHALTLQEAIALTDIEIIRIDLDLLDIMMTWDQLALVQNVDNKIEVDHKLYPNANAWMHAKGDFSLINLKHGIFSRLPPANIEEMFRRMTRMSVKADQVIIRQGEEGDFYYFLEQGQAQVTRVGSDLQATVQAILVAGNTFGEEALAADIKRNATVSMLTDGELMKLNKHDFIELLKQPLLNSVSLSYAEKMVTQGAIWLDVRQSSEYKFNHHPKALNVPLGHLREMISLLDTAAEYVVYCRTGRRSSAAAFILIQNGFKVSIIKESDSHL